MRNRGNIGPIHALPPEWGASSRLCGPDTAGKFQPRKLARISKRNALRRRAPGKVPSLSTSSYLLSDSVSSRKDRLTVCLELPRQPSISRSALLGRQGPRASRRLA